MFDTPHQELFLAGNNHKRSEWEMVDSYRVIHGSNDDTFDWLGGTTISSISHNLADAFNVPPNFLAFVNGERVPKSYQLQENETVEFVVVEGRKGAGSHEDFLSEVERHCPFEKWDDEKTLLKLNLYLDAASYNQTPLFDLPPVGPDNFSEHFLVSPDHSFAYQNRILLKGFPLVLHSIKNGMVVFNNDVVLPTLIDLTTDSMFGDSFSDSTELVQRAKMGAVWMSLTPSEILTQRPGVIKAQGTVLIGGLGLGWLLKKVCEKDSVERVIVVERSQELLDWYGYDLCKRYDKVSDVICDDVFNQIGKHGDDTIYLLDIWLLYSDAKRDPGLKAIGRDLKNQIWAWGM
jgi:hypothetical protein